MDFLKQDKIKKWGIIGGIGAVILLAGAFFFFGNPQEDEAASWWNESSSAEVNFSSTMETTTNVDAAQIYVDLKGAVKMPGVYRVASGSRLFEVIILAGGLLETADEKRINQASVVTDQLAVYIPEVGEEIATAEILAENGETSGANSETADKKININTADATALQTLLGIGNVKAQAIMSYRLEHGSFQTLEDLKKVAGIGEATFTNVKELITIG